MDDLYDIMMDILHENDHYRVHSIHTTHPELVILDSSGCAYTAGYAVISKATEQIELIRTTLPDALYNAEHMSNIMATKPYMWLNLGDDEPKPGDAH